MQVQAGGRLLFEMANDKADLTDYTRLQVFDYEMSFYH
jgi:hypothetical protein